MRCSSIMNLTVSLVKGFGIDGINLINLLVVRLDREDQVVQLSPTQRKSL